MAVATFFSGGVTKSQKEGGNFGGFLPHWECNVWAVYRYEFATKDRFGLKPLIYRKLGQNSIS